jgi:MFS family permease
MAALAPALTGLCGVAFLARISYALARTPVLALFAVALGAGPEAVGLAVGISTITGILFKMPAGAISDVVGRSRMLLLGLCVFAFVPFTYLWVDSYHALLAVRFLHGFATAIYGPVAMAVVVAAAGDRRAEALAWFSSVSIVGNLIGAPLGGWLLTTQAGGGEAEIAHFHVIYAVVGAFGSGALLLALWVLRGPGTEGPSKGPITLALAWRRFWTGVREILFNRQVFLTSNMEGVQNLSLGALEAFFPVYIVVVCGFSPFQAGLVWGVQAVTTLASKPLMGRWSDRRGRHGLLFWGMFLCAVPFALIPWTREFSVLLVLSMLFGLGEAVVTSSAAALVADLCEESELGTAMGAFGTLFDIGHATGPILAGALLALSDQQDFRLAFAVIGGLLVISALAFRWGVGTQTTRTRAARF